MRRGAVLKGAVHSAEALDDVLPAVADRISRASTSSCKRVKLLAKLVTRIRLWNKPRAGRHVGD
jgi:hypothetical protein